MVILIFFIYPPPRYFIIPIRKCYATTLHPVTVYDGMRNNRIKKKQKKKPNNIITFINFLFVFLALNYCALFLNSFPVELAMIMDRLYGGVCYAGIDTDPELKYPKGAGRVAFSNQQSYIAAISARFVQLQHGDIDKRVSRFKRRNDYGRITACGGLTRKRDLLLH